MGVIQGESYTYTYTYTCVCVYTQEADETNDIVRAESVAEDLYASFDIHIHMCIHTRRWMS